MAYNTDFLRIYLVERQINREEETDFFPNGYNSQGWARLQPGSRNSILVFYVDDRYEALGSSPAVFPGILAGGWIRRGFKPELLYGIPASQIVA